METDSMLLDVPDARSVSSFALMYRVLEVQEVQEVLLENLVQRY